MSLSLAQITDNIKSEIKIDSEGRGFVSIRGVARLAGINASNISRSFDSVATVPTKLANFLLQHGVDSVAMTNFSTTGVPDMVVGLIVSYYANQAEQHCTETAKMVVLALIAVGVRTWCRELTGYTKPVPQLPPQIEIREPLWVKQLPPMPEIYDQGAPDEVNYYGLIPGIDYPDPYVLEAWDKTYKLSSQCQQWQHLREAKWKKEDYLRQFDRDKLIAARVREVAYGKEDQSIFNGEYRKLLVMGKIRHLKEPLPLNIHHRFYTIPAVVARYKTHYPFLTTLNIWTMFIEAEQEGLGRYDLETQCFYPICCLPHIIAAQKELEQLATVENGGNNRN